jgi:2-aminoethylphosphonate-pyruvate transaminase
MKVTKAVVLAAGLGSRLKSRTSQQPKGFLELNGASLIARSCHQLARHGIEQIFIGTGHLAEAYEIFAAGFREATVRCVRSDRYATTGSMYTLYVLKSVLDGAFLLLESDLLYESRALQALLSAPAEDVILASGFTGSGDEVYLELDAQSNLVALSKNKEKLSKADAELVGINKLSLETYHLACDVLEEKLANEPRFDYEHALAEVSRKHPIQVLKEEQLVWCEIDNEDQLTRATNFILPQLDQNSF